MRDSLDVSIGLMIGHKLAKLRGDLPTYETEDEDLNQYKEYRRSCKEQITKYRKNIRPKLKMGAAVIVTTFGLVFGAKLLDVVTEHRLDYLAENGIHILDENYEIEDDPSLWQQVKAATGISVKDIGDIHNEVGDMGESFKTNRIDKDKFVSLNENILGDLLLSVEDEIGTAAELNENAIQYDASDLPQLDDDFVP